METINRLVLVPATFVQVWAGRRFYARPGGPAATAARRWTRSSRRDDRGLGLQRRRDARSRTVVHEAGLHPETYFDSSTIILGLVLLGRWLEARAKGRASGAIRRLDRAPGRRRRGSSSRRRRPRGPDRARSSPATCSASGPATGRRSTASSSTAASAVDESMLTGEAMPVAKGPGDEVFGATVNTTGHVRCSGRPASAPTRPSPGSSPSSSSAQGRKAPIQRLADRISEVFVPAVAGRSRRSRSRAGGCSGRSRG